MNKKFENIQIISNPHIGKNETSNKLTLESFLVGERIQLIPSSGRALYSQYIGYIQDKSILVTIPKALNPSKDQLINVRIIIQGNLYTYQATVLCLNKEPIAYMHLSYPNHVSVTAIRKQTRVSTSMEVRVSSNNEFSDGRRNITAKLTDYSSGGASVESQVQFGNTGDKIIVTGDFKTEDDERTISIPCFICQVRGWDDVKTKQITLQHGIRFEFVNKKDEVFVQDHVTQQINFAKVRKIL